MRKKRILSLLLAAMLTIGSSLNVMAAEASSPPNNIYEDIVQMLNAEYGINMRFMTDAEREYTGLGKNRDSLNAEDFEAHLRQMIKIDQMENEKAAQAIAASKTKAVNESGSFECKPPKADTPTPLLDKTGYQNKEIAGATAHLDSIITNRTGYWIYYSIANAYTINQGVNSKPAFSGRHVTYNLLDARRTCALTFTGYTYDEYGVVINNNASRYVEFWAGSAA